MSNFQAGFDSTGRIFHKWNCVVKFTKNERMSGKNQEKKPQQVLKGPFLAL